MLHKKQGVLDLFNYFLDFMGGNIQKLQLTFFVVERLKCNYKKRVLPCMIISLSSQCSSLEKVSDLL